MYRCCGGFIGKWEMGLYGLIPAFGARIGLYRCTRQSEALVSSKLEPGRRMFWQVDELE